MSIDDGADEYADVAARDRSCVSNDVVDVYIGAAGGDVHVS